jgi:hypothetical protein
MHLWRAQLNADTLVSDMGTGPDRYDPENPLPAADWLALDEHVRSTSVERYHRIRRIRVPGMSMHVTLHVIVENQLAEGHVDVAQALDRLQRDGMSRHDAIHAIASVLVVHLQNVMAGNVDTEAPHDAYFSELRTLSAESWRAG